MMLPKREAIGGEVYVYEASRLIRRGLHDSVLDDAARGAGAKGETLQYGEAEIAGRQTHNRGNRILAGPEYLLRDG
jgi:hypothetical protein